MADNSTTQQPGRQSGSIMTFVLIALVLLALTCGAVLVAKWRGDSAKNHQAEIAASGQDESKAPNQSGQSGDNTKPGEQPAGDQSNPGSDESESDTDTDADTAPSANPTKPSSDETETQNLASAGPTDVWASLLALSGLSYALTRFLASRRHGKAV